MKHHVDAGGPDTVMLQRLSLQLQHNVRQLLLIHEDKFHAELLLGCTPLFPIFWYICRLFYRVFNPALSNGHSTIRYVSELLDQKSFMPHYLIQCKAPQPVYISVSSLLPDPSSTGDVAVLSPCVFRHPIRRDILHLCVNHYLDGRRQGTATTKSRGEVRGSGRKIRQQKGSGRARLGDGQSPMLRGGGHTFAKKARDFSTKLPRKVMQMGMRVLLSAKVRENNLGVVEVLDWPSAKTSELGKRIRSLGWQKALLVTGADSVPETLVRASRALDCIATITAADLNIHQGLKWDRLVLDIAAVDFFERKLGTRELGDASQRDHH